MTFDERAEKRADQRKRAEEKRRIAEMRGAEHREAGAPDNQKGAVGKTRCAYGIGGLSKRTSQEKRKKLREDFQKGLLHISDAEFDRQMKALEPKMADSTKSQPTLLDMFKKRPRAPSIPSETQAFRLPSGAISAFSASIW
ncbi:hypothetical protein B0H10DRAFT_1943579 [Mycena sp. CBHHK59/15]|nr:hypothetical protein B0H10DRAFT_1943579 [Mycena sp. CBHHK59/15]